ncbi:MAG: hypothetical protein EXS10_00715 [Phycisphaerales bacterium]|nr:hypothetical protein [Phycisphaerales bacterium]
MGEEVARMCEADARRDQSMQSCATSEQRDSQSPTSGGFAAAEPEPRPGSGVAIDHERAYSDAIAGMKLRRESAIDALVAEARRDGTGVQDRMYWTIFYDMERAPATTNRAQLRVLGIDVPLSSDVVDAALPALLASITAGLARWGVYFQCTDHLSDREFYDRLSTRVLEEQIAELPPDSGATEHIDFAVDASSEVLDWYASRDRNAPSKAGLANRDRFLPTPPAVISMDQSITPVSPHDLE